MASVFQRGGRWQARFKGERGLFVTRSCGGADKQTAQGWANAWEAQARDVREGRIDPRAERYRAQEARPIGEHIDDWRTTLQAKGDCPAYVVQAVAHVRRVAKLGRIARLGELTPDAVRRAVAQVRDGGRSLRTCNAVLRSIKSFAAWAEADRRIRRNELRAVAGFNERTDRRLVRRDLDAGELQRLIAAAQSGPTLHGLDGPTRAMAYTTAAGTGFRRAELRSLVRASFHLDDDPPCIAVTASYSKRRRDDSQPIDGALAEALRPWLADKPDGAAVFPLPDATGELVASDLRRARAAWIREADNPAERRQRARSDYLAVRDSAGRTFDFHALRHHYVSSVVRSGASVRVAQELARHCSPVLTIGKYAHTRIADLRSAVPSVPLPGGAGEAQAQAVELRATGTDDSAPRRAPLAHQTGRNSVSTRCNAVQDSVWRIDATGAHKSPENQGDSADSEGTGRGRIRTSEGISHQIYSLARLAASVHARCHGTFVPAWAVCTVGRPFSRLLTGVVPRPARRLSRVGDSAPPR